jgi:hypothetical protein
MSSCRTDFLGSTYTPAPPLRSTHTLLSEARRPERAVVSAVRHPLWTAKCIPIRPRPLLALLHLVEGRQPRRHSPDKDSNADKSSTSAHRRRHAASGTARRCKSTPTSYSTWCCDLQGAVRPLNTHTHHHLPSIAATAAPPTGVVAGRLTGGGTRRPAPHGGVSGRPHGTGDGAATGRYRLRSQHSRSSPPSVPLCLLPLLREMTI